MRLADATKAVRAGGEMAIKNHADSIDLAARLFIGLKPGSPRFDVSWDGRVLRTATEAYVLLHEIAHYQLASPAQRCRVDFGLGPGPETGDRDRATRAQCLFGLAREREEAMASLLGILWEAELGHPALASLLDQNWLEGAGRSSAAVYFADAFAALVAGGFVDRVGRPQMQLRRSGDVQAASPAGVASFAG
ncbi:MAG: hypothetical protein KGL11_04585 [Alphaproteobacteria bacterium]|nr:hypothetical protein [Alphaproteobacteria bacterium]